MSNPYEPNPEGAFTSAEQQGRTPTAQELVEQLREEINDDPSCADCHACTLLRLAAERIEAVIKYTEGPEPNYLMDLLNGTARPEEGK